MRKLSVALIILGTLSLTACGDKASASTTEKKQETSEVQAKKKPIIPKLGEVEYNNPQSIKEAKMTKEEKEAAWRKEYADKIKPKNN